MDTHHIEINKAGFYAAMEALIMDDPHPGDDVQDSPSHWLERALYAYEWAKQTYIPQNLGSMLRQEVPLPGKAREAVLIHERRCQHRWITQ